MPCTRVETRTLLMEMLSADQTRVNGNAPGKCRQTMPT